jgi:hypothetical protein
VVRLDKEDIMLGVYPLRPVVCDEPHWQAVYDNHPASVQLASACISTREALGLLADGAAFESVVLLNGAGEGLPAELAVRQQGAVPVERVRVHRKWPGSVELIHGRLVGERDPFFEVGGGG